MSGIQKALIEELSGLLDNPGCIFCRGETETIRRYWFWYLSEQYGSADTRRALRLAVGFCPSHSYQLAASAPASTLAIIYEDLLADGVRHLSQPRANQASQEPCPLCQAIQRYNEYLLFMLEHGWSNPNIKQRIIAGNTVCVPHFWSLTRRESFSRLTMLMDMAQHPASPGKDEFQEQSLSWLIQEVSQPDWHSLAVLPKTPSHRPVLQYLEELLARESCPLCVAEIEAEQRYFEWLLQNRQTEFSHALDFCRAHVRHFLRHSGAVGEEFEQTMIDHLRARTRTVYDAGLTNRVKMAPPSRNHKLTFQINAALNRKYCPVCSYQNSIVDRLSQLIAIGTLDSRVLSDYQVHGGVCYRHLAGVLTATPGRANPSIHDIALTELQVLEWEIKEFIGRLDWNRRYEPKGSEQQAPYRAATRFSGLVLHPKLVGAAGPP